MFRLFITNFVLQFCIIFPWHMTNARLFGNTPPPLIWFAIACLASSLLYALLRIWFWRLERLGRNIFLPIGIFGALVGFAVYADAVSVVKLEERTMIGWYTFFWLASLSVLAWKYQGLLSIVTSQWMFAHGIVLCFAMKLVPDFFMALICYEVCCVLLLIGLAVQFIIRVMRTSGTDAHSSHDHCVQENDGIPPGGYGSSHV